MKLLLYCTKAKPYLYRQDDDCFELLNKLKNEDTSGYKKYYGLNNGKIVAECDFEVEEIGLLGDEINIYFGVENKACLTTEEIENYLGYDNDYKGYAIHIKNLHIFDDPRDITKLVLINQYRKDLIGTQYNRVKVAPQNMCMVDYAIDCNYKENIFDSPYILISIRPDWLCKILNGEKTIEIRKKVLKEILLLKNNDNEDFIEDDK